MDFYGAPMSRTWVKLGADANPNDTTITLSEPVTGWNVGDEVIVTGGPRGGDIEDESPTEERTIKAIDGTTITLDSPLKKIHWGGGEFRSEIANLSRNVIVESADPNGEPAATPCTTGAAAAPSATPASPTSAKKASSAATRSTST